MNKELLTDYEYKILYMLAKSYTRKHICEELNISYRKCKKIIDDLCAKFETPNVLCCLQSIG
jgi:bacterial regulatory proteins, luxR family